MNEFTIIMGIGMFALMFISIFVKGAIQWSLFFAVIILGVGIGYQLAVMPTVPIWLLLAVVVVVVGYTVAMISHALHNA